MKTWIKSVVVAFGGMALVAACEPGGGSDADSSGTGTDGTTDGVDGGVDGTDGSTGDTYPTIELDDDDNNETLTDCDPGTIKSPGADIDGAELTKADGTSGIYMTSCTADGNTCDNDNSAASNAEGAPDSPVKEVLDKYTSLNGGLLRCNWTGGAVAESGDTITVVEVGGTSSTTVEQYNLRLCASTGGLCTADKVYGSGSSSLDVSSLF